MRKMMQRSLSCLLTLAMVVTMLMTSTLAAEKSAKLEFDYSANYCLLYTSPSPRDTR